MKGFTLIELLAVLVILAIILLIAYPLVSNLIYGVKRDSFESSIKLIIKAVEQDYMKRNITGDTREVEYKFEDSVQTITPADVENLDFSGTVPKDGFINVLSDGSVEVKVSDGKFYIDTDVTGKVNEPVDYDPATHDSLLFGVELTGPALRWESTFNFADHFILGKGQVLTALEVSNLISTQGYIPIASAAELNQSRNSAQSTFGSGTPYAGLYTAGLNKKYIQVADIDLASYPNWVSIGNQTTAFTGLYNGNGYYIRNLTQLNGIDTWLGTTTTAGLFGISLGGNFSNIILENVNVTTTSAGAALLGYADYSGISPRNKIDNCHVLSGEVKSEFDTDGEGYGMGGLVGYAYKIDITNSSTNVYVNTAGGAIGGLVGDTSEIVTITNSKAMGNVRGSYDVGGLVGFGYQDTIINSASYGDVIGVNRGLTGIYPYYIGGLSGRSHGTINNSYSRSNVTIEGLAVDPNGDVFYIAGLVGYSEANINKSFSTGNIKIIVDDLSEIYYVGGFTGENAGDITDSYSTSSIAITGNLVYEDLYTGGFVGANYNVGTSITNSYYNGTTTLSPVPSIAINRLNGFIGSNNGILTSVYNNEDKINWPVTGEVYKGVTSAQIINEATYVGWDFTNTWIMK